MSQQHPLLDISLEATAQLVYGTLVKLDSSGRAVAASAATDRVIGVVQANNGANTPYQCTVRVAGIAQVLSDGTGTVAPGDPIVASSTSGKGVKDASTLGTTNKKYCLGTAMNSVAATANLLIDVLIEPYLIPST